MAAIRGSGEIKRVLGNFRDAMDYILTETLRGLNRGKDEDWLAAEIRRPKEHAQLPCLAEHYGCVEWTVRAICTAYLGWFDGNPTHLHPHSPKGRSEKTVTLMGGAGKVFEAAGGALKGEEYQWCLELCDLLLELDERAEGECPFKDSRIRDRRQWTPLLYFLRERASGGFDLNLTGRRKCRSSGAESPNTENRHFILTGTGNHDEALISTEWFSLNNSSYCEGHSFPDG